MDQNTKKVEPITQNEQNETKAEEKLLDLGVAADQAEDAKAGGLTLNYTKVTFNNVGMGTAND